MKEFRVGLIGYTDDNFDKKEMEAVLSSLFDCIANLWNDYKISVVVGTENILPIVTNQTFKRDWPVHAIPCCGISSTNIDENEFLNSIDFLIRIGAKEEYKSQIEKFHIRGKYSMEYDL